jgi:hypothetical protein
MPIKRGGARTRAVNLPEVRGRPRVRQRGGKQERQGNIRMMSIPREAHGNRSPAGFPIQRRTIERIGRGDSTGRVTKIVDEPLEKGISTKKKRNQAGQNKADLKRNGGAGF